MPTTSRKIYQDFTITVPEQATICISRRFYQPSSRAAFLPCFQNIPNLLTLGAPTFASPDSWSLQGPRQRCRCGGRHGGDSGSCWSLVGEVGGGGRLVRLVRQAYRAGFFPGIGVGLRVCSGGGVGRAEAHHLSSVSLLGQTHRWSRCEVL